MFKRLLASLVLSAALVAPAYAQVDIEFGFGFPPPGGGGGGFPGGGFPGGGFPGGGFPGGGFPGGGFPGGGFPGGGFPGGGFPGGGFPGGFPGGGFPGGDGFTGTMFRNPGTPYDGRLPPTSTTSVDFDITECSWCGQGGYMISNEDFNQLNKDLAGNTKNLQQLPPGFVPGGGGNMPGPGGKFPGSK